MRIALATLLCTLMLPAVGGTRAQENDKTDVERDLKTFQGTWTFEFVETGRKRVPADALRGTTVTFEGDTYTVKIGNDLIQVATQKLNPSKSPKTFDAKMAQGPHQGTRSGLTPW